MLAKLAAVWIVGLFTVVPCGIYYLFFHASREQYAALITWVLFWLFGYWGVAGPLLGAIKVRRVFQAIEGARSGSDLLAAFRSSETRDVAVALIASEHRMPRFIAARVYDLLLSRVKKCA